MKRLDAVLGPPLVALCARLSRPGRAAAELRRVLVIRPGGIGDAVLLVPALQALRAALPGVELWVLAEDRNAGVFGMLDPPLPVLRYHRPGELLRALRGGWSAVVDSEQWHRLSAVVAWLTGAPLRIGFATNQRRRLFTHPVGYRQEDHEVQSFLRLMEPLMGPREVDLSRPFLRPPAGRLLEEGRWLVIAPGASVPERSWPAERFRAVARWAVARGMRVALVGGVADRPRAEGILQGLPGVDLVGSLSLPQTAQVLAQAEAVVCLDSGLMHLAVALGTPVVALFGPGIAAKWAPRDGRSRFIDKRLPCSPCTRFGYTPPCPHGMRCMLAIEVEEVVEALDEVLATTAAP